MNGTLVEINGKAVQRITYKDTPVVTLPMVDELHERSKGHARKTFNRNKKRMIEGEDYYYVPPEEWNSVLSVRETDAQNEKTANKFRGEMVFLTETGYLMLVKVFDDDLSWQIQRMLVRNYFASRSMAMPQQQFTPEIKFNFDLGKLMQQPDKHLDGAASLRLANYLIGMPVDDLVRKLEQKAVNTIKTGKSHEVEAVSAHLYALLDVADLGPEIERGTDTDGCPYLQATTERLLDAMLAVGKKKRLPKLDFSPERLGSFFTNHAAGFDNLGWQRERKRTLRGQRFYRYTCFDTLD